MNQPVAIPLLLIVSSSLLISANCQANSPLEEIEVARQLLFACQESHVLDIDDKQSDVSIVALNLTNLCLDEYQALNRTAAQYNYETSNERRMFTIEKNSNMLKIEASLPVVNQNRHDTP